MISLIHNPSGPSEGGWRKVVDHCPIEPIMEFVIKNY